jgi:hypothetical protein
MGYAAMAMHTPNYPLVYKLFALRLNVYALLYIGLESTQGKRWEKQQEAQNNL